MYSPDYSILTRGSENLANATAGLGQQIGQGIQGLAQGYVDGQQKDQQEQMQSLVQAALDGDSNALSQVNGIDPELGIKIQEQLTTQQGEQQLELDKNALEAMKLYHNTPDDQKDAVFARLEADPSLDVDNADRVHFDNPDELRADIAEIYGKDVADAYFMGADGGNNSLPAEAVTFNDLIKDMTLEQQKTAKLVKAGLKGRAISNAELTAIKDGTINSYSEYKVEQKQKEKFAEATGASRARIIDKGFESINKSNTALRNIDKAIAAIDGGAGVGVIEKMWPSIKASSVELDNIRGQMALDVVGATTFGALSKGELDLAKDVALPTGLDSAELKDYLIRKKSAQERLRDYYEEQIQHLDSGGTIASFRRMKKRGQTQPNEAQAKTEPKNQNSEAMQWAQANPNDPRSAQILSKLGVQ